MANDHDRLSVRGTSRPGGALAVLLSFLVASCKPPPTYVFISNASETYDAATGARNGGHELDVEIIFKSPLDAAQESRLKPWFARMLSLQDLETLNWDDLATYGGIDQRKLEKVMPEQGPYHLSEDRRTLRVAVPTRTAILLAELQPHETTVLDDVQLVSVGSSAGKRIISGSQVNSTLRFSPEKLLRRVSNSIYAFDYYEHVAGR